MEAYLTKCRPCRYLYGNQLSGVLPDLSRLRTLVTVEIHSGTDTSNAMLGGEGTACSDPAAATSFEISGASVQVSRMGIYTQIELTAEKDYPERGGRPVFYGPGFYLYYLGNYPGDWSIGLVPGSKAVYMYVVSNADHPMAISAEWTEWRSTAWISAPNVQLTCIRK